jgi:hypothetical protein
VYASDCSNQRCAALSAPFNWGGDTELTCVEATQPKHYIDFLKSCGFKEKYEWYSAHWDLYGDKEPAYRKLAAYNAPRETHFRIEPLELRDSVQLTHRLLPLFNNAWQGHKHPFFAPLANDELRPRVADFIPLMPPLHIWMAYDKSGADAGCTITLAQGKTLVMYLCAVLPAYKYSDLAFKLSCNVIDCAYKQGYQDIVSVYSFQSVTWPRSHANVIRTYAIYACEI